MTAYMGLPPFGRSKRPMVQIVVGTNAAGGNLVGVIGFEPTTPSSRTRCSTRLSHTPTDGRSYSDAPPAPQAREFRRRRGGPAPTGCELPIRPRYSGGPTSIENSE